MGNSAWIRILPFAVFMSLIGLEEFLRWLLNAGWLSFPEELLLYTYPVRAVGVAILLLLLVPYYSEIHISDLLKWRHTLLSVMSGCLIFLLWVNMDWDFATFGEIQGFNPGVYEEGFVRNIMLCVRFGGAVLVVPLIEEIFWRSFLIRYAIDPNYSRVAIGSFTWFSFLAVAVLFGLEHHLFLAGIMAGVLFNIVLYLTRSIIQCVVSHATANLALGIYVLQTGQWHFW